MLYAKSYIYIYDRKVDYVIKAFNLLFETENATVSPLF